MGKEVTHKIFGLGTIVATNALAIKVRFKDKEREFLYPDAFLKGFLKGNILVYGVSGANVLVDK